ncbi:MAG: chlorite dismutase family protein [Polyangiaceae bacterium]|nr:chlorite dismutase family protein [Polyangiaceae bacterium]
MSHGPSADAPEVRERGAPRDGAPQLLDRRLFFQLLVFEATEPSPGDVLANLRRALVDRGVSAVVYADVGAPAGFGLLSMSEDPADFVTRVRVACHGLGGGVRQRHELTMLGRTYSTGYEQDLEHWLLERPRRTVMNEEWPWAIWYPLRRTGAFERLDAPEKGSILREHGTVGRAYGEADLAHDVRLACHGLDANDNDFVIGLVGRDLHPLSHVVQTMRKTRQTAEFMHDMGPFFVGRAAYRTP